MLIATFGVALVLGVQRVERTYEEAMKRGHRVPVGVTPRVAIAARKMFHPSRLFEL